MPTSKTENEQNTNHKSGNICLQMFAWHENGPVTAETLLGLLSVNCVHSDSFSLLDNFHVSIGKTYHTVGYLFIGIIYPRYPVSEVMGSKTLNP